MKPNLIENFAIKTLELEKFTIQLPEIFNKTNVFIQIKSMNKTTSETYFSTSLKVQIIEAYGQIKVLDNDNKPISKV